MIAAAQAPCPERQARDDRRQRRRRRSRAARGLRGQHDQRGDRAARARSPAGDQERGLEREQVGGHPAERRARRSSRSRSPRAPRRAPGRARPAGARVGDRAPGRRSSSPPSPVPWTARAADQRRRPSPSERDQRPSPAATSSRPATSSLRPPEGVGGPAERQREQRDRDRVGGERDADRLVAGPGALLDLRQQGATSPNKAESIATAPIATAATARRPRGALGLQAHPDALCPARPTCCPCPPTCSTTMSSRARISAPDHRPDEVPRSESRRRTRRPAPGRRPNSPGSRPADGPRRAARAGRRARTRPRAEARREATFSGHDHRRQRESSTPGSPTDWVLNGSSTTPPIKTRLATIVGCRSRRCRDHPVVLEPVAGDHRERDQEGDELRPDGVEQRPDARPRLGAGCRCRASSPAR